jgi:cell division protein FtsB
MQKLSTYLGQVQLKLLPIFLVLLLIFLQYRLWFDAGGIIDILRLKKQSAQQTQKNAILKKHNQALRNQVQYMQANQDAVESHARQELGMIRKGEIFYQVINKEPHENIN